MSYENLRHAVSHPFQGRCPRRMVTNNVLRRGGGERPRKGSRGAAAGPAGCGFDASRGSPKAVTHLVTRPWIRKWTPHTANVGVARTQPAVSL
ncbi:hypothetical protein Ssi02_57340 [Sinosporangium siamense]|uniref:Uncharacterized protein n=1 Tax=Sinosporangium siamense TaxID=1367973 RepID=A0A919RKL0_9ACTN|nr:hypothetical protein Ssi02_57340 [Sinosporangium siamense]